MSTLLQLFLLIIILVIAAAFAALNEQVINLNYFIGQLESKLTYVIIFSFLIGMIFSFLMVSVYLLKQRLETRRLRNTLRLKTQELSNLRQIPLKDNI